MTVQLLAINRVVNNRHTRCVITSQADVKMTFLHSERFLYIVFGFYLNLATMTSGF